MGEIIDLLQQKLKAQISGQNPVDPNWVTVFTQSAINNGIQIIEQIIQQDVGQIVKMGPAGLTLFLQQITLGNKDQAIEIFIQTQATPQDIIDGMMAGAVGVIGAKQKIDDLISQAETLLEKIGIATAQILLPILINMI